jgi:hypothetical protein
MNLLDGYLAKGDAYAWYLSESELNVPRWPMNVVCIIDETKKEG